MNGAAFFLVVNFIVALSFSAFFVVVARRSHSRTAAMWLGAGFGVASLSAISELLVAFGSPPRLWALCAFATVLIGMTMLTIGVGEMYHRRIDARITAIFVATSLFVAAAIYDLPRGTALHAFLYQGPFALVILAGAMIVLMARQRTAIDRFLGILLLTTGLHFFMKAGLAVVLGAGSTARDYVQTSYALISQSLTAVLMVAVGLTLLAKLVLEILAIQRTESEIDSLSGLANRRGFDRQITALLRNERPGPHAIILCDLDHFKQINDTYGHHVGDMVIQAFADCLARHTPEGAVVGRLGGEEFALFLPDTQVDDAVQLAQLLRRESMTLPLHPQALSVTASFGIAQVLLPRDLSDAMRRADQALYRAKDAGRNRVKVATPHLAMGT
ncbi:GGDEF domain-containing protein [Rhizobium sp. AQ_MP]|uniref:GGDEF domain-containing protein n=1 Tax=Rhizobium sp. AQ_MP TaxID=2761536 RepID=UPI00163A34E3|nr:GGDEF domain-containing protein [Rhizobium sp. AQ_MP]MBC2775102.1 GGDEF domain-containing protein [Rhizobium sp. AQ_MP]